MKVKADNKAHVKLKAGAALLVLICMLLYSCKEKYVPEIKDFNINYLVVEGLINTGGDSTIYNLSRTFKLNNKPIEAPEKGAIVQVESDAGETYVLQELKKAGRYGRPPFIADQTKKYRLRIRTKDNREYLSDFVGSKLSPQFDLRHEIRDTSVHFYVDTYDPSGKSIYYQHSYEETWEYNAYFKSYLKIVNGVRVDRIFPEDDITTCWRTLTSGNILLATTNNLSEDRLADRPIISVPGRSQKLNTAYSLLVKQTVLTREGFEFYESLRKNTESVGSIFDAQPSLLFGNIRSTKDPSETVIGFISAGSVTQKRIIIHSKDLPSEWFNLPDQSICEESLGYAIAPGDPFIWVFPPLQAARAPLLYCADCRLLGGTTKRPSYWK
nr:DUF4249 domain-containing protein [uncultured Mucilaginibacter sp.]